MHLPFRDTVEGALAWLQGPLTSRRLLRRPRLPAADHASVRLCGAAHLRGYAQRLGEDVDAVPPAVSSAAASTYRYARPTSIAGAPSASVMAEAGADQHLQLVPRHGPVGACSPWLP
jgi:hypothetical protein